MLMVLDKGCFDACVKMKAQVDVLCLGFSLHEKLSVSR